MIHKDKVIQESKVSFSDRIVDQNLKNRKKNKGVQKRKRKRIVQNQTLDENNNQSKMVDFKKKKNSTENISIKKKNINNIIKKVIYFYYNFHVTLVTLCFFKLQETELDSQMREYYRKVEEQKLLREKFLLQKENRRKKLAMEKSRIKKNPFFDPIGIHMIIFNNSDKIS